MVQLEEHWPRVVGACPELRRSLLQAYGEPRRRYHDTRHLAEVLEHLTDLLPRTSLSEDDRHAVVLAAWFHDAVYNAARDDEECSAALAEETLPACGLPSALVAEVGRLVRLTREHRPGRADVAGQVLCDADLAILAAAPERYQEYTRAVREEYAEVEEPVFRAGRSAVLRGLLKGPLFHTPQARESWEARARTNVERELAELDG
jgi:predicted metal-dependent HD superfamily phosphohydrolase